MKRFLFSAVALAALLWTSCAKEEKGNEIENTIEEEWVTITVSVPLEEDSDDLTTKTTSISNESTISELQVFVFRPNGVLEAYAQDSQNEITVSCTTGSRTVVALVNAPVVSDITTLKELRATVSYLGDNSLSGFVMYGEQISTIYATTPVSVAVSRLVARISISSIENRIDAIQYQSEPIKVTGIYLVNVVGDIQYKVTDDDYTPTIWYNQMKNNAEQTTLLKSDESDYICNLSYGNPYSTTHYFYCYPNSTLSDNQSTTWSERCTRLVVETLIDGQTYYYPITIEDIKSNYQYDATLIITRIGSDSPDSPVVTGDATVSITVTAWQNGKSYNTTI